MSGPAASSSDSHHLSTADPAPALRLLPGGRTPQSAPAPAEPVVADTAARDADRPAMAVRIRMICKMLGEDPTTARGTRLAMKHLRLRRLAVARSVTRPGRVALTERKPRMAFTWWEVFGQFGRVAPKLVGATIRDAERRFGTPKSKYPFARRTVEGRRATTTPVEVITNGRVFRQAG